jgi:pheromone shutdown protein TraB
LKSDKKGEIKLETNVHRLQVGEKEIILIGTAHVSPKSVEEVKELIENERPDSVCIELCQGRYNSIVNKDQWQNTDIGKIIKEKQTMLLLATLIMSSFQKRIAKNFEVAPGQEMIKELNLLIVLVLSWFLQTVILL